MTELQIITPPLTPEGLSAVALSTETVVGNLHRFTTENPMITYSVFVVSGTWQCCIEL